MTLDGKSEFHSWAAGGYGNAAGTAISILILLVPCFLMKTTGEVKRRKPMPRLICTGFQETLNASRAAVKSGTRQSSPANLIDLIYVGGSIFVKFAGKTDNIAEPRQLRNARKDGGHLP